MIIVRKGSSSVAHRQNFKTVWDGVVAEGRIKEVLDPSGRSRCGRVVGELVDVTDAPAVGIKSVCRACWSSVRVIGATRAAIGLKGDWTL